MNIWLLTSLILIIVSILIWSINKISKIFKGKDGKFSTEEFLQMIGSGSLLTMSGYIIYMEATRVQPWQLFGPTYIFLVIGGFLSITGLGKVLDTIVNIFGKNKNEN